jgi:hypothetical protein
VANQTLYMYGHAVIETLMSDESYTDIALIYDQDRRVIAGLFEKRGESN